MSKYNVVNLTSTQDANRLIMTGAFAVQPTGCVIEENVAYPGNDLNDGNNDPRQNDVDSCQSYCKTNYPAATHFEWVSPSHSWTAGHKTCWCKHSNAGRVVAQGSTSGELICGGRSSTGSPITFWAWVWLNLILAVPLSA